MGELEEVQPGVFVHSTARLSSTATLDQGAILGPGSSVDGEAYVAGLIDRNASVGFRGDVGKDAFVGEDALVTGLPRRLSYFHDVRGAAVWPDKVVSPGEWVANRNLPIYRGDWVIDASHEVYTPGGRPSKKWATPKIRASLRFVSAACYVPQGSMVWVVSPSNT